MTFAICGLSLNEAPQGATLSGCVSESIYTLGGAGGGRVLIGLAHKLLDEDSSVAHLSRLRSNPIFMASKVVQPGTHDEGQPEILGKPLPS